MPWEARDSSPDITAPAGSRIGNANSRDDEVVPGPLPAARKGLRTMFRETMRAAIDSAGSLARFDEISRTLWQAHAAGHLDDNDAQRFAEHLEALRKGLRPSVATVGAILARKSIFPTRRLQRTPERSASIERQRRLAASGPMPPALAARFTPAQLAVLKIVADEVAAHGQCELCIDAVAARAGVCRRLAQKALRLAQGDGLLVILERPRQGRKSDTNIVRIFSREWRAWIERGRRIGCTPMHPTDKSGSTRGSSQPAEALRRAAGKADLATVEIRQAEPQARRMGCRN